MHVKNLNIFDIVFLFENIHQISIILKMCVVDLKLVEYTLYMKNYTNL